MKTKKVNKSTGINLVYSYPVFFLITSAVLYLANLLYPECVVLGNQSISYGWSFIHIAGTLAMLDVLIIPIIKEYENKISKPITTRDWFITYFIANFFGFWIMSKFANNLGMGLKAWYSAALMSLVQAVFMVILEKNYRK